MIAATGTAKNIPKTPKYAPPIVIETIIKIGLTPRRPARLYRVWRHA